MPHKHLYFEEKLNTISHAIGLMLAFVGSYFMAEHLEDASTISIVSGGMYLTSVIVLYAASTMYHYFVFTDKHLLYQKFDHISIYLLIAGTYTPVCLVSLIDSRGLLLFIFVWSIALLGIIFKVFYTGRFVLFSTLLYLVMGWLIIFDITHLKKVISEAGMQFLFYGGAAYTIGIVFYLLKKVPFTHFIWHLFVLAGSMFHFWFIYQYVF